MKIKQPLLILAPSAKETLFVGLFGFLCLFGLFSLFSLFGFSSPFGLSLRVFLLRLFRRGCLLFSASSASGKETASPKYKYETKNCKQPHQFTHLLTSSLKKCLCHNFVRF